MFSYISIATSPDRGIYFFSHLSGDQNWGDKRFMRNLTLLLTDTWKSYQPTIWLSPTHAQAIIEGL